VLEENDRLFAQLTAGELDGVCFYGGWADKAAAALADNAILFHDEKLVRVTVVHAALNQTLEQRPQLFKRLLKAYLQAEEYVRANPAAALKAVVDYLKLDPQRAQEVFKPAMIHVALEQSLVKDLENLAQWQLETGLRRAAKVPNYLDFISFRSLAEVDPKRVTIVRPVRAP